MLFIVVLIVSVVIASFFGHVIHWALHQHWTGPAHAGHMEHHEVHYPMGKLVSDEYKSSRWYHSGVFLFTPPFLIILATFGVPLWYIGAPHWVIVVFGASLVGFGLLNDYVHDVMHLRRHWLDGFRWYRGLRMMHFLHHHRTDRNFGIVNFTWDRVFGTKITSK